MRLGEKERERGPNAGQNIEKRVRSADPGRRGINLRASQSASSLDVLCGGKRRGINDRRVVLGVVD